MENLTKRWTQSGHFPPKSKHLLRFSKRAGQGFFLLPPSWAPVIMNEYASLSQNMPKYPWKSFINCYDHVRVMNMHDVSYIFDRLLETSQVLIKSGFLIWYVFLCKDYAEFQIFLIMAPYASIVPQYCLSMH